MSALRLAVLKFFNSHRATITVVAGVFAYAFCASVQEGKWDWGAFKAALLVAVVAQMRKAFPNIGQLPPTGQNDANSGQGVSGAAQTPQTPAVGDPGEAEAKDPPMPKPGGLPLIPGPKPP